MRNKSERKETANNHIEDRNQDLRRKIDYPRAFIAGGGGRLPFAASPLISIHSHLQLLLSCSQLNPFRSLASSCRRRKVYQIYQ
ncbi:hypothetical protein AFLA_008812 [Aspergillus flavus NRRL3357]|nr:hypothetical protein AFLA_008812 [Aspergillus flavus NRRL3357]